VNFLELRKELLGRFSLGVTEPLPGPVFDHLALRVFRFQCLENPGYRGFVARRGVDPDAVTRWQDIPFLPARAFKSAPLVSGDPAEVERIFRTSGTTGGREARGEHHVRDLALYRASLLPNFQAHLLPEGGPVPMLCLLPAPEDAPDSSLSFMMGEAVRVFGSGGGWDPNGNGPASPGGKLEAPSGGGGGGFFVHPTEGIEVRRFREALDLAVAGQGPVLLAGTAFAFLHWLELAGKRGWRVRLPEGSRIMETGGYKGRARALAREDLYRGLTEAFGVPARRIVSEYGMTELLSQFYEPVLAEAGGEGDLSEDRGEGDPSEAVGGGGGPGWNQVGRARDAGAVTGRFHRGPPWVRTRILDPLTLGEVPEGAPGLLAHVDLANLGSVSAILTEDMGRRVPGGFQLVGRSQGAEPRGCSLAMEDFLGALGEGP
jgi:hypothetical protein